ncbi:MAG: hypothetical protein ACI814_002425, partial [Mariniblastus sp.]
RRFLGTWETIELLMAWILVQVLSVMALVCFL